MSTSATETQAKIFAARTYQGCPPDAVQVPYRSLADLLDRQAQVRPDQLYLAYYDDDTSEQAAITYAQFRAQVAQVAHYLRHTLSVQRGERVATVAINHPATVCLYWACWSLGASVAPQNVSEDDDRIAFILRNANVRVVLCRPEYLDRVRRVQARAPNVERVVVLDDAYHQAVAAQPVTFGPSREPMLDDECLLVYTSGTTGAPKGVQLTQYNLLVDARGITDWLAITPDQRFMCVLPIHHMNGIEMTLVTPLYAGSSVVLTRSFKASVFWKRLQKVSIVSVVPTLLQILCEAGEDIRGYDLSRFRHLVCGAGTLALALTARFTAQFGLRITHGYGLSETTCFSSMLPPDLTEDEYQHWMRDFGYPSIGVPIWPNEMAIHDPLGQPVPAEVKGEIVIRGHNVMAGYFERPDANAETFKHGWFRSGDEGFFQRDSQGRPFFFITGRLKELINRGGVKYSPFEIEEVLLEIPGVKVGLAVAFDNVWFGEEVGAYVVREPGAVLSEADVLAYCQRRMPFAKCPKAVVFGEDIPVTTTGKYQRLRLKDLFKPHEQTQFRADG